MTFPEDGANNPVATTSPGAKQPTFAELEYINSLFEKHLQPIQQQMERFEERFEEHSKRLDTITNRLDRITALLQGEYGQKGLVERVVGLENNREIQQRRNTESQNAIYRMNETIEKTASSHERDFDSLSKRFEEFEQSNSDIYDRLSNLERWRWVVVGAATGLAGIATVLVEIFF